ncbi:LysR family transcriptional regulator [Dehalobacter sp. DCM]|uniref:LysR family transcriptional regulator n=1 Tax=Dehalobacter sp. DCM TaxID=2907827 RepID=UPI003082026D|nr:LysR family transcriptional regulator [Dehalobacter sp. DCM]
MNTKNLIYVLTVAEERSFSNAAKLLYISQPSLSQSISAIEKELGTPIFDRSSIPLSLTYAGEKYLKAATEILAIERKLNLEIEDILGNRSGRLVIGLSSLRCASIIPHIFPIFLKEFPGVELILKEGSNEKLTEMVVEGKADLALATPLDNREMDSVPLLKDNVLLAVYHDHPLIQNLSGQKSGAQNEFQQIDLTVFKEDPFILLSPENHVRNISDQIFTDYHIVPRIILESASIELAHRLVTQGMGLTFILESMINLYGLEEQSRYFQFTTGAYTHNLNICYRKDSYLSKIMLNFIRIAQTQTQQQFTAK